MAIYKTENSYVISSNDVWLPGSYDTERAAKYAFRFSDEVLHDLQKSVNPGGVITFSMLQEQYRKSKDEKK